MACFAAATEPAEDLQVLDCSVAQALPSPAAEAADGGFNFAYQSLGGLTDDGRSCTVYRLRNRPGSPPTPVRWQAGDEVLVDLARLKRCGSEEECPWFEVASYFEGRFEGAKSQLSFGLNADSFRLQSDSLVASPDPDVGASSASVGTEVVGTITLADESEVEVDLLVKSRFERRDGVVVLIYEVTAADPGLLSGDLIRLAWSGSGDPSGPQLPVDARSLPFISLPLGSTRGSTDLTAERGDETVAVEVVASGFEFVSGLRLSVVETSRPEVSLLSVPLPAFVPSGR